MTNDDLRLLRRYAACWGRDPTLVQGAGGNVSIKTGDSLWIKASGTWLADAEREEIFVPVTMPLGDPPRVAVGHATPLRPSIEISLHAMLPHRVVIHVHSVDAIAHLVQCDPAGTLAQRLAGLDWALVPYFKPGPALGDAVRAAHAQTGASIFLLANHGLVIAADQVSEADNLLSAVVSRLALVPRPAVAPAEALGPAAIPGFHTVATPEVASLAADLASLAVATAGVLYPDHVVFLGAAPLVVDRPDEVAPTLHAARRDNHPPARWIIVRDRGVLLADDALRGSVEMLRCIADVAARIPPGAPLAPLGRADVSALIDWDAERYRQALATRPVAHPPRAA